MTVDTTFEFEKRRNRPVRYNRELMTQTLTAMKRVSEIQNKRQDLFYKMRMKAHKGKQKEEIRAEIEKGIELIAPAASNKELAISNATNKIASKQKVKKSTKKEAQMEMN